MTFSVTGLKTCHPPCSPPQATGRRAQPRQRQTERAEDTGAPQARGGGPQGEGAPQARGGGPHGEGAPAREGAWAPRGGGSAGGGHKHQEDSPATQHKDPHSRLRGRIGTNVKSKEIKTSINSEQNKSLEREE